AGRKVALYVLLGEHAVSSDGQLVEGKTPDLDADEALHLVAELEKHFADLPLEALGQDDLEGARSDPVNVLHPGETLLDGDALFHLRREGEIEFAVERDDVGFAHFGGGMGQALGQVAVVG